MTESMSPSSLENVSPEHLDGAAAGFCHHNSTNLVNWSGADHDDQVTQFLAQYERFGIDLGLDRILHLLQALGNPHHQVPIIHVAGSNGKGSVCAYLSSILTAAGYRVGRYISPHLVSWCERICINDQPIPAQDLGAVLAQVAAKIDPQQPSPTQFEVITAAAWCYFAVQKVDIAVIEVGLGGRLDATNVCDHPLVTVITALSLEHWQRLGPTLADIAREKAGILKPACPAVIAPLPPEAPEVKMVLDRQLQAQNSPAFWPAPAQPIAAPAQDLGIAHWGQSEGIPFPLPLPGQFQLSNAALAIASIQQLRHQDWQISDAAIATGMGKTRWPGRMQWLNWQGQKILIDGAHNPAAAIVLRQYVDSLTPLGQVPQPIAWVLGMLTTKDHGDVLKALLRPGDYLHLVPVPGHSGAAPQALAALAQHICPDLKHCQTHETLWAGLEAAVNPPVNPPANPPELSPEQPHQAPKKPLVVFCGSLYLIGDFFAHLQSNGDPKTLR
jgi:dihydrofolate synthase / folylpolyglutamate synthase